MNTRPVTAQLLRETVMAVPPLCRDADGALNHRENIRLIRHIEAGGMTALLYGGNANLYNVSVSEYEGLLEFLAEAAGPATTIIPSVGPDFGKMMDQARVLRQTSFPTAMVLPTLSASTSAGVAAGVRRFAQASGKPAVLYIKDVNYISVQDAAGLARDGVLSVIKYAIVRDDPADDAYLRRLVDAIDPAIIMSGIGEQPAVVHLRDFKLGGFTTGCGCVGPALSMRTLEAIQRGDWPAAARLQSIFKPLEDLRNTHSPIRVLHEAVRLAGIADTGPLQPLMSNISIDLHPAIAIAAQTLLQAH